MKRSFFSLFLLSILFGVSFNSFYPPPLIALGADTANIFPASPTFLAPFQHILDFIPSPSQLSASVGDFWTNVLSLFAPAPHIVAVPESPPVHSAPPPLASTGPTTIIRNIYTTQGAASTPDPRIPTLASNISFLSTRITSLESRPTSSGQTDVIFSRIGQNASDQSAANSAAFGTAALTVTGTASLPDTTATSLIATGSITAARFIGDGSQLTGLGTLTSLSNFGTLGATTTDAGNLGISGALSVLGNTYFPGGIWNSSGSVGIGTTTPAQKLHVEGTGDTRVYVGTSGAGQYSGFELYDPTTSFFKGGIFSPANSSNKVELWSSNGGANPVLVATLLGNGSAQPLFGIGSTTPYATLSVKGAGTGTGVNFQTTNSSNAPLFTILDSGNVGIGTTSPLTKLSIQGTAGANDVLNVASSTGASLLYVNAVGNVGIGTQNPLAQFSLNNSTSAQVGFRFISATTTLAIGASDLLQLQNVNGTNLVNVNTNGNIETQGNFQSPYGGMGRLENLLKDSDVTSVSGAWGGTNVGSVGCVNVLLVPDGSGSVNCINFTVGAPAQELTQIVTLASNTTYTFSAWVVGAGNGDTFKLQAWDGVATSTTANLGDAGTKVLSTTEWRRVSLTFTTGTVAGSQNVTFLGSTGQNRSYYIWGTQLEKATQPGPRVKTPATQNFAAVNGLSANSVSTNSISADTLSLLRLNGSAASIFDITNDHYFFGYSGLTFAASPFQIATSTEISGYISSPFGGLGRVENLVLDSQDITTANWALNGSGSRTANAIKAPDGTLTGNAWNEVVGTPLELRQNITGLQSNTQYTLSFWLQFANPATNTTFKATIFDGTASTTVDLNVTSVATALGAGKWRRYKVTGTTGTVSGTPAISFLGNGGANRTWYLWGIQLAADSDAGPYAKTGSISQVTNYRGGVMTNLRVTSTAGIGTTTNASTLTIQGNAGTNPFNVASSTGASLFYVNAAGNVGIGTTSPVSTLSIQGSLCVTAGNATCGTTAGTIYADTAAVVDIDLAENYPTTDGTLGAGEIVAVDLSNPENIKRASAAESAPVLGVISTKPGFLLGSSGKGIVKPVALSGRVPVRVNTEGGAIAIGDHISLSSVPGVGKKAAPGEDSVAIALSTVDPSTNTVVGFVENRQYQYVGLNTKIPSMASSSAFSLSGVTDALASLGAKIEQGIATFVSIVTDRLTATNIIANTESVDNLSVGGGITMKGKDGKMYCIIVDESGTMRNIPGACDTDQLPSPTPTPTAVPITGGSDPGNLSSPSPTPILSEVTPGEPSPSVTPDAPIISSPPDTVPDTPPLPVSDQSTTP